MVEITSFTSDLLLAPINTIQWPRLLLLLYVRLYARGEIYQEAPRILDRLVVLKGTCELLH